MNVIVRYNERETKNARLMAIQHHKSVEELTQSVMSAVMSGKTAWILLEPAPPAEVIHEVREAVNRIINKERSLIYVPDQRS